MEMDDGAGASRVFPRYAPKEGATYYRSQTNEGERKLCARAPAAALARCYVLVRSWILAPHPVDARDGDGKCEMAGGNGPCQLRGISCRSDAKR